MKEVVKSRNVAAILASSIALASIAGAGAAIEQQDSDLATREEPLVLENRGSLVIGGDSVARTPQQLSSITDAPPAEGGHVTINQMYVEFMEPQDVDGMPVVMVHGATLSGKSDFAISHREKPPLAQLWLLSGR